jgi:predicted HNH restriction endonuclease
MAKPPGPRPIIVEIATPFGLKILPTHWSNGSTVRREYFQDLFPLVVGRPYDGKLDKRSIAESLLLYAGGSNLEDVTITDDMFSDGSTITNSYFNALKKALETCKIVEREGLTPSSSDISETEMDETTDELPEGGHEGRKLLVSHYRRERSKALSLSAKRIARNKHPERLLVCEICSTIPEKTYKEDTIEAHHRTPLNKLAGSTKVMPADLAMICPNCHRAVHKVENCSMPEVSKRLKAAGVIK